MFIMFIENAKHGEILGYSSQTGVKQTHTVSNKYRQDQEPKSDNP